MKFPIQRKTLVGFGVALVVLITINALSYWSLLRHRETDYWVAHTYQVQQKIEATLAELTEVETGQRGYLLMGEEDYLKIYNNNASLIDKQIRELEILTVDNPRQQQRINTLKPLAVRRLAALSQVIELRKKRDLKPRLLESRQAKDAKSWLVFETYFVRWRTRKQLF
jgi:CHASE3 domain sensor protein